MKFIKLINTKAISFIVALVMSATMCISNTIVADAAATTPLDSININLNLSEFEEGKLMPSWNSSYVDAIGIGPAQEEVELYKRDNFLYIKGTQAHVDKGYVSQADYDNAYNEYDGWIDVDNYNDEYRISKGDEYQIYYHFGIGDGYSLGKDDIDKINVLPNNVKLEKIEAGSVNMGFKIDYYVDMYFVFKVPVDTETPDDNPSIDNKEIERIYGATRYETSIEIANALKAELGLDKFNTIIIANGENFPDALAGSYLASKKNAPIIMVNNVSDTIMLVQNYITKNLVDGGKVYILGGNAAVSETVEKNIKDKGYDVQRLKGNDRYETNIAILNEAGISNEEILVCTGMNFADSLSASATGLPILLVNPNNNNLENIQKDFLRDKGSQLTIIGGDKAVTENNRKALEIYDVNNKIERISGETRFQTSVKVANRFFVNPKEVVTAYAMNYPDGLCGGPLAYVKKAPMILTASLSEKAAIDYIVENKITVGTTLGGEKVLSNETVNKVFGIK